MSRNEAYELRFQDIPIEQDGQERRSLYQVV